MKIILKKTLMILLAVIMLAGVLVSRPAYADTPKTTIDAAVLLQVAAHARIDGIDDRAQLWSMRDNYRDLYNQQLSNPNLDDDQKAQIIAIRDAKIAAIDEKVRQLEIAWRRRQRARSPIGIAKRVVRVTGDVIGQGITVAKNTVVRIISNPKELLINTASFVLTGGVSSIKDAVWMIIKSEVKREVKKAAYAELVKIAFRNKTLRKAVRLKEFLGIKGNEDLEAAIEEYLKKEAEKQQKDDDDWGDIGPEGEGGYDDPDVSASGDIGPEGEGGYDDDDEIGIFYQSLEKVLNEQGSVQYNFTGNYTYDSINIAPASAEQIYAEFELDQYTTEDMIERYIAVAPDAAAYENAMADAYVGTSEEGAGFIDFIKNGDDIETRISMAFITDLICYDDLTVDSEKHYIFHKYDPAPFVVFEMDNLALDVPVDLTYTQEYDEYPYIANCTVTINIDSSGYIHMSGTYSIEDFLIWITNIEPVYDEDGEFSFERLYDTYGLCNNSYTFEFISAEPIS